MPIDWRILGFGAALTFLTGLVGLIPALRLSAPEVGDALSRAARGRQRRHGRFASRWCAR